MVPQLLDKLDSASSSVPDTMGLTILPLRIFQMPERQRNRLDLPAPEREEAWKEGRGRKEF